MYIEGLYRLYNALFIMPNLVYNYELPAQAATKERVTRYSSYADRDGDERTGVWSGTNTLYKCVGLVTR